MSSTSKKRTRHTEKKEEKRSTRQKHERGGREARRRLQRVEEENEIKRQQTREAIRRLMRVGSVLDPPCEAVFRATKQEDMVATMKRLMNTLCEEWDGIELVDPMDAMVAVTELYEEEIGNLESEVLGALFQCPDVSGWPPGLLPMVAQFASGGRSEREWQEVKSEYVESCDTGMNEKEWKWMWTQGTLSHEEPKNPLWKDQKRVHPLVALGIWSWSNYYRPAVAPLIQLLTRQVRRHPDWIKAVAILFYVVVFASGITFYCWDFLDIMVPAVIGNRTMRQIIGDGIYDVFHHHGIV